MMSENASFSATLLLAGTSWPPRTLRDRNTSDVRSLISTKIFGNSIVLNGNLAKFYVPPLLQQLIGISNKILAEAASMRSSLKPARVTSSGSLSSGLKTSEPFALRYGRD